MVVLPAVTMSLWVCHLRETSANVLREFLFAFEINLALGLSVAWVRIFWYFDCKMMGQLASFSYYTLRKLRCEQQGDSHVFGVGHESLYLFTLN